MGCDLRKQAKHSREHVGRYLAVTGSPRGVPLLFVPWNPEAPRAPRGVSYRLQP
jgi:hypothetical protein